MDGLWLMGNDSSLIQEPKIFQFLKIHRFTNKMKTMALMIKFILPLSLLNFSIIFAIKIECGKPIKVPSPKFPVTKDLGTNYEVTIRSTNWLKANETAKFVEQNFDGTLVVRKWTRKMETIWYNRSIVYEDYYRMPDAHHLVHNRSCRALPNGTQFNNPFALSRQFLQSMGMAEEKASFGELLNKFVAFPEYNGTIYDVEESVMGVEVVGWRGCVQNVSGHGLNLQLNVRFAGDHTSQEPYNPYWNNPLVYTVDLVFYEGSVKSMFDELSLDIVTLDRVHLADREFTITPPSGVFCQGMPPTSLPVQFPFQFLAQISTTRMEEASKHRTRQNMYFYDAQSRIVAYSPEIFPQKQSTELIELAEDKKWPTIRHIIHDFTYGFQYLIASNGTCQSIGPIEPNSPDVTTLPDSTLEDEEDDGPGQILFMLHPEETLIWHGRRQRMAKNAFYYAGKVKSSETDEPLAVYSTIRPKERQKWAKRNEVTNGTAKELVEIQLSLDENGHTKKFHSILAFNGTNEGEGGLLESQRIFIIEERMPADLEGIGWRNLHSLIRPCIKLERPTNEVNGTSKGSDFYVQLANVTLSQLDQTIGRAEAMGAIAQALAIAANISQLRIVDLKLKELATGTGNGNDNILVALFSIGRPVEGIKPAKTAYLKKEISVQEAAAALNSTIRANQFKVRIPMEQTKKDWNISGSMFGTQSSLFPSWPPAPIPTPSPKPSPPSFVGYSGSALAICSIFAFVLGAALSIGGYIFYQKRQHIRG